jgi:2'-5' RNA ligase
MGTYLFSAIPLVQNAQNHLSVGALVDWWTTTREECSKVFKGLRPKHTDDLHLTMVYVGPWQEENLKAITELALVMPTSTETLKGHLSRFGARRQVLAIDFDGASKDWSDRVIAARKTLTEKGFRRHTELDQVFRPHISLVETKNRFPEQKDFYELDACSMWLQERLTPELATLVVDASTVVDMMVTIGKAKHQSPQVEKQAAAFPKGRQYLDIKSFRQI